MSSDIEAVARAKDVVDALLSRPDLRQTLCNCPDCFPVHIPLEKRVLEQRFHHASLAIRHWRGCGAAHEADIPNEPNINGDHQRHYAPAQVYDGLVARAKQTENAVTAKGLDSASTSTSDSSESSDVFDGYDSSDSEGDILFDHDFRTTVCTPSLTVGGYAKELRYPPSLEWLQ